MKKSIYFFHTLDFAKRCESVARRCEKIRSDQNLATLDPLRTPALWSIYRNSSKLGRGFYFYLNGFWVPILEGGLHKKAASIFFFFTQISKNARKCGKYLKNWAFFYDICTEITIKRTQKLMSAKIINKIKIFLNIAVWKHLS